MVMAFTCPDLCVISWVNFDNRPLAQRARNGGLRGGNRRHRCQHEGQECFFHREAPAPKPTAQPAANMAVAINSMSAIVIHACSIGSLSLDMNAPTVLRVSFALSFCGVEKIH